MLEVDHARQRQQRLAEILVERELDAAIVGAPHHVYYFSTHWTKWTQQSAMIILADGRSCLVTANKPNERAAADVAVAYEAQRFSTFHQKQLAAVVEKVVEFLTANKAARVGVDQSAAVSQVML